MGDHTPLLMRMVDTPPPSASVRASASATPEMIGLPTPLAPNTQPKMPHAQTPIEEEETEVLKVSGAATLYQSTRANDDFNEEMFNTIFDDAERRIFEYSRTEEGTDAFNYSSTAHAIQETRDISEEIEYIPHMIKECAKTILEYFLKNRLATNNVFKRQIKYGMYQVISLAIIEYYLKMHEWDNIFVQIHRNPFRFRYDPYILQDVSRFITGMVSSFRIEPTNPAVSQEISDMMNLIIKKIVRSFTEYGYGGKISKRSVKHKRMKRSTVKRSTVKHKRMKRRTVKQRTVKRMKRRTIKMHKKKC
jgi:hypothetical protein